MNAQDIEKEDRLDVAEAERRLADPAEVPIPYELARRELFPSSGNGLDASDIEALVAPVTEPARNIVEEDGGWLTDAETGAVVGHAGVNERFRIDSSKAAEWALELRQQIEAEIAALDARLEALRANLLALRAEQVRRLAWWDWRFGGEVIAFARRMLAGGKTRTWRCAWGRVSFRKSKGHTEILDMKAAVEFVKEWAPYHVVVTETVGVKGVLAALEVIRMESGEEPEKPGWLKGTGETESVKIDTGIHVKKGVDENGD